MPKAYVHALRFRWLNGLYDLSVRALTRETAVKKLLVAAGAPAAGKRVLDLGCGSGTLPLMLKAACPEADIHGLDGDADMLSRARRKAGRAGIDVRLHLANALDMPFPDNVFDLVTSSLFFHHLGPDGKRRVFEEARRVLRPGGRLVIADFGRPADPLQWILSWPVRWFDGWAVTRENFQGKVPGLVAESGFDRPRPKAVVRTPVGTIRIMEAVAGGRGSART